MKLYKIDSKGKIRSWMIEKSPSSNAYRTIAGIEDGKKTISEWTKIDPKNIGKANETSVSEQLDSEVKSLIEKKIKKGYISDLKKASVVFSPMLAKNFEKWNPEWTKVFVQPKLDGIRCIATVNGLFTRNGESIVTCDHIYRSLKPIFKRYPKLVLDGELYSHGLNDNFNKIVSLVKKTKPSSEDIVESSKTIEFHIYDMVSSYCFSYRDMFLKNEIQSTSSHIKLVKTHSVNSSESLEKLHKDFISDGYEGSMIRIPGIEYEQKRSRSLLKKKDFKDDEFEIVNIFEGKGNWAGMAKRIECLIDGKNFGATLASTQEYAKEVFENRNEYIGGKATVSYFSLTPDGIPRFGTVKNVFRKENSSL